MDKFLKQLTLLLRYGHDDFKSLLSQMNYHDYAGDEHADHTKRGILADAYEEVTGDTEGANHLRKEGQPVAYHEGKMKPAIIKEFTVFHPTWIYKDLSQLSHQELIDLADEYIKKEDHRRALYDRHPNDKQNTAHIDDNRRGYKVYLSPFTHDRRIDKMITVPIEEDHKGYYNPRKERFE